MGLASLLLLLQICICSTLAGTFTPSFVIPNNMGVARSGAEGWGFFADSADTLYNAGGRWIRASCGWGTVESTKGVYNFDCYNAGIKTLLNRKFSLVVVLFGGNSNYIDNGLAPWNETHREGFVNYVNASVNLLKGRGIIWEVWNEPDGTTFWKPGRNATNYMLLFQAVSTLFKQHYPNEILGGAAVSYFYMDFLESLFKGGLLDLVDVFTIHSYRGSTPETLITSSQFEKSWNLLNTLMQKYTPTGKYIPRAQTEYGYSLTNGPASDDPIYQGHLLARQYLINMLYGVSPILWYDWMNDCQDQTKNDCTMGLIMWRNSTLPIVPKPTFTAFSTLSSLLSGYQYFSYLNTSNSSIDYALSFKHSVSGQIAIAAWTTSAASTHKVTVTHDVSGACFDTYDTFMTSLGRSCSDTNSQITLSISAHSVAYMIPQGSVISTSTSRSSTTSAPSSSTSSTSPSSTSSRTSTTSPSSSSSSTTSSPPSTGTTSATSPSSSGPSTTSVPSGGERITVST